MEGRGPEVKYVGRLTFAKQELAHFSRAKAALLAPLAKVALCAFLCVQYETPLKSVRPGPVIMQTAATLELTSSQNVVVMRSIYRPLTGNLLIFHPPFLPPSPANYCASVRKCLTRETSSQTS